jgi:hypothetical protein
MRIVSLLVSSLFVTSAVASMLGGCSKSGEREPAMTPANAPNPEARAGGEQLASTLCDRAQRCHEIGGDAKYGSREHCMTVMRNEAAKKVNKCLNGLDQNDLRDCVNDIANQACGGISETWEGIGRGISCNMDDLCS